MTGRPQNALLEELGRSINGLKLQIQVRENRQRFSMSTAIRRRQCSGAGGVTSGGETLSAVTCCQPAPITPRCFMSPQAEGAAGGEAGAAG